MSRDHAITPYSSRVAGRIRYEAEAEYVMNTSRSVYFSLIASRLCSRLIAQVAVKLRERLVSHIRHGAYKIKLQLQALNNLNYRN